MAPPLHSRRVARPRPAGWANRPRSGARDAMPIRVAAARAAVRRTRRHLIRRLDRERSSGSSWSRQLAAQMRNSDPHGAWRTVARSGAASEGIDATPQSGLTCPAAGINGRGRGRSRATRASALALGRRREPARSTLLRRRPRNSTARSVGVVRSHRCARSSPLNSRPRRIDRSSRVLHCRHGRLRRARLPFALAAAIRRIAGQRQLARRAGHRPTGLPSASRSAVKSSRSSTSWNATPRLKP